jgi:hypothetical protein
MPRNGQQPPRGIVPHEDPEKRRESVRKWRAANPEKVREANLKWRTGNRDKARLASRKYREANLEKDAHSSGNIRPRSERGPKKVAIPTRPADVPRAEHRRPTVAFGRATARSLPRTAGMARPGVKRRPQRRFRARGFMHRTRRRVTAASSQLCRVARDRSWFPDAGAFTAMTLARGRVRSRTFPSRLGRTRDRFPAKRNLCPVSEFAGYHPMRNCPRWLRDSTVLPSQYEHCRCAYQS